MAALQMAEAAFGDEDIQEVLQAASGPITAIHEAVTSSAKPTDTADLLRDAHERYKGRVEGSVSADGTPTGIWEIDRSLKGLWPGRYWVIGAYPSGGKSLIGSQISVNLALKKTSVGYLPLEMSNAEVTDRALIQASKVPASAFGDPKAYKDANGENDRIAVAIEWAAENLAGSPFHVLKPANKQLNTILSVIRRAVREKGIKVAVIDFVQQIRVTDHRASKEQVMEQISHAIAELKDELQIHIILLSQLSKEGDTKHGRVIEEDADAFFVIEQEKDRNKANFNEHQDILIVKDRHYGQGGRRLPLILDKESLRFITGEPVKTQSNKPQF